jgi:hypothetical protein
MAHHPQEGGFDERPNPHDVGFLLHLRVVVALAFK